MSDRETLKPTVWQPQSKRTIMNTVTAAQLQANPNVTVYSPEDGEKPQLRSVPDYESERPNFDDLPAAMRESLAFKFGRPARPGPGPRRLSGGQLADMNVTAPNGDTITGGATAFQRESDLPDSVFQFPDGVGPIEVHGTQYPANEIRFMNSQLNDARRAGYFPTTLSPPTDFEAIVDDYQMLCQLRDIRGDTDHLPTAWKLLRVEISRRIEDRDAALQSQQREAEAARRINSYMHAVNMEHRMFNDQLSQHGAANQQNQAGLSGGINEQLRSMVKTAVEQSMAQAAAPLRMNTNRLSNLYEDIRNTMSSQSQQFMDLQKLKMQQNEQLTALEEHTKTMGGLTGPQQECLEIARTNLDLASTIVTNLTQVVDLLPNTINQVVQEAVQKQTEVAIREVMETQARMQQQFLEQEAAQRRQQEAERANTFTQQRSQSSFRGGSPLQVQPTGGLTQRSIRALVRAFIMNGALRSTGRARDGDLRVRRSSSQRKSGNSFKDVFGGKRKDGGGC